MLLVMPDQWPRALLRSALREAGYDAIGTRSLASGLRVRASDPRPASLIVVDQAAVAAAGDDAALSRLLARHADPPAILVARTTASTPAGPWTRVLRRPVSVAEIVGAVESLLPLPAGERHPVDEEGS